MSNIADLMLQKGQIQANARLGSAQAKTQAITGIANTIAGTIADIPRMRAQEVADKQARIGLETNQINLDTLKKNQAEDKDYDAIMGKYTKPDTGEVDYTSAIRELTSKGLVKQAREVSTLRAQDLKTKADTIKSQLDAFDKRLGQARTLLHGVTDQQSLDRIRPVLVTTMGDELGQHIPTTYDKATIDSLATWGADAKEVAEWQKSAMDSAKAAADLEKGSKEALQKEKESWAQWVATTGSQKELDDAMNVYFANGWSPDTVTMFGTKWSPDLKKKATEFAIGAKEVENNKIQRAGQGVASAEATERARENQRQDAIKWREDEMAKLREKMRTPKKITNEMTGVTIEQPPMTQPEFEKEQRYIQESYDRMVKGIGGATPATSSPSAAPKTYKYQQTKVINGVTVQAGSDDNIHWFRIK